MKTTLLACAAAVAIVAACSTPEPKAAADTIYTGGDIVTVNDAQPSAEALAVKDGKIVAVGTRAEVEKAHKGASTTVVDLGGKALLPGFLDAHSHYISSLTVANQVNVYAPPAGPGKDADSIVAELVKFRDANKIPKGEVIQAYGYDENVMPKGRLLNRDHLDKAFPDNPVLVGHVSMHGAVLNSRGDEEVGHLGRDQDAAGRRHRAQAGHAGALRPDHGDGLPADLRVAAASRRRRRRSSGPRPASSSTRSTA